jgi:transketolase
VADDKTIEALQDKALEMRKNLLRLSHDGGWLHIGGDLSLTDIMTVVFQYLLHVDPACPNWEGRDRFVLSKGHGAGALYMAMAARGYFDKEEVFATYGRLGSRFGMHPCRDHVPGVEASTGSLGHGLPIAVGLALSAKRRKRTHRVVAVVGDGECDEGTVWEAAMAAAHYGLGNLVVFVDKNGLSMDGFTRDIMNVDPLDSKFASFNWSAVNVDGHDIRALTEVVDALPGTASSKPTAVIARTTKGKGVEFMENKYKWHAGTVDEETLQECYARLDAQRDYERALLR